MVFFYRAAGGGGAGDWHETGIHAIENVGDSDARYLVVARSAVALPPSSPDEFTPRLLEVAGDQARVLLENDAIRVLDVSLPMNDTLPRHYGGHRVVYSLTSSELLEMCENTGSAKTFCRAGQAHWQDAGVQTIKNVGRLAHILVFELKR